VAGFVPGGAVLEQRAVLPRGARRPVAHVRPVRRRVPVPAVVVRRVGGGARGRPPAHRQRPPRLPAGPALRPVLAGAPGESLCQVSTLQQTYHQFTDGTFLAVADRIGL